jgi:hypothetical protein
MGRNDILTIIKSFSIDERLFLIEDILSSVREDHLISTPEKSEMYSGESLVELAGIVNEKEAKNYKDAISESRKIDINEW